MITFYCVVDTDNYAGDYPNEKFISTVDADSVIRPCLFTEDDAKKVADTFNTLKSRNDSRFYKVVKNGYTLQGGFEP